MELGYLMVAFRPLREQGSGPGRQGPRQRETAQKDWLGTAWDEARAGGGRGVMSPGRMGLWVGEGDWASAAPPLGPASSGFRLNTSFCNLE